MAGLRPHFERVGNVTHILLRRLPRFVDLFAAAIHGPDTRSDWGGAR
jgi:hypothetical protein